jgi:hypothetical protein
MIDQSAWLAASDIRYELAYVEEIIKNLVVFRLGLP